VRPLLVDANLLGRQVTLSAYPTLIVLGAVLGIALSLVLARWRGLPLGRSAAVYAAAIVAAPVGGRLMWMWGRGGFDDFAAVFVLRIERLAMNGGLVFACASALVAARLLRVDTWKLADVSAPGILLGAAVAKLACYCEGCCFGPETTGPLGVVFPLGSQVHGAQLLAGTAGILGPVRPVIPTQVVEATALLLLAVLALAAVLLGGRDGAQVRVPAGVLFLAAGADYALVRLLMLPIRPAPVVSTSPPWFNAAFYAAIAAVCISLIAVRFAQRSRLPSADAE
jgi:phosphatidylglycerol:prolipoprotein diacylglycerol transferase